MAEIPARCCRVLDTPCLPQDIQEASWSLRECLSAVRRETTAAGGGAREGEGMVGAKSALEHESAHQYDSERDSKIAPIEDGYEYEDEGVWEKVREGAEAQERARRALGSWGEAAVLRVLPCVDAASGRDTGGVPDATMGAAAGSSGVPGGGGYASGVPGLGLGRGEWLQYLGPGGAQSGTALDAAVRELVVEVSSFARA